MMRQTAVILLVILSGSLETRALLRQLSEDKVRNKRTDFPVHPPGLVMPFCHEHPLLSFITPCLHLSTCPFFTSPVYLCLKAKAKTEVPPSSPFLIPAVCSLFDVTEKKAKRQKSLVQPALFSASLAFIVPDPANLFTLSSLPILILDRYRSLLSPFLSFHHCRFPPPCLFPSLTDR